MQYFNLTRNLWFKILASQKEKGIHIPTSKSKAFRIEKPKNYNTVYQKPNKKFSGTPQTAVTQMEISE